ncbi:MAG: hypothetical protein FOGNACKC_00811 [Anaerolineae bacterium]|nr:hypothetical protein [Anaerolineae bacterium]
MTNDAHVALIKPQTFAMLYGADHLRGDELAIQTGAKGVVVSAGYDGLDELLEVDFGDDPRVEPGLENNVWLTRRDVRFTNKPSLWPWARRQVGSRIKYQFMTEDEFVANTVALAIGPGRWLVSSRLEYHWQWYVNGAMHQTPQLFPVTVGLSFATDEENARRNLHRQLLATLNILEGAPYEHATAA